MPPLRKSGEYLHISSHYPGTPIALAPVRYGFVIDNTRCIGCHACSTACKSENEVPIGVARTWVKTVEHVPPDRKAAPAQDPGSALEVIEGDPIQKSFTP